MTVLALRAAHLLFMGLWVAAGMYLGGDARRSAAAGPQHHALLRDRVRRALRFNHVCAVLTLGSGVGLILALGGFGAVSPAIHAGFGLSLVLAMFGWLGLGRAWAGLDAAIASGESRRIRSMVMRFEVASAGFKTVWLVVFALMVFRHSFS